MAPLLCIHPGGDPLSEPTAPVYNGDTDLELDDLGAELDDASPIEVPATVAETAEQIAADDSALHTAVCRGGPYAGRTVTSRMPKGILLVDMPVRRCWRYDLIDAAFVSRDTQWQPLLDDGVKNRWRAIEEQNYEVLAYDDGHDDGGPGDPDEQAAGDEMDEGGSE